MDCSIRAICRQSGPKVRRNPDRRGNLRWEALVPKQAIRECARARQTAALASLLVRAQPATSAERSRMKTFTPRVGQIVQYHNLAVYQDNGVHSPLQVSAV